MKLSSARTTRFLRAAMAAGLALLLVALAPGLAPYEAAAQMFNGAMSAAGRGAAAPVVPVGMQGGSGGVSAIPSASNLAPSLQSGLAFTAAPTLSGGLVAAPAASNGAPMVANAAASAFAPAASGAAFPVLPASALLAPSAAPSVSAAPAASDVNPAFARADVPSPSAQRALSGAAVGRDGAPVTVLGELEQAGQNLEAADAGAKDGFLARLFTGARSLFGLSDPSPVAGSAPAAVAAPSAFAALTPLPLGLAHAAASASGEANPASGERRATPPSPVVKVGDGLNPGAKLLSGESASAAPETSAAAKSAVQGPQNDDWIDTKGMVGMFTQRSLSIALFIQTSLAYPFVAIGALKANALAAGMDASHAALAASGTFGALMALGPLAAIATGPLNGLIADKMSPRNGLIMLSLARAAQTIMLPVLAHFGYMNFWTLLGMSIANGWQLSLLMTSENAYLRRLAGKNHLQNLNALNAVNYLALQVFLTLILGVGALIDKLGPMTPFYASSIILPLVVVPIIWFMVPNTLAAGAAAAKAPALSWSERLRSIGESSKAFLKKYWKEIGLLGAALGVYIGYDTTLPMSAALFWWVSRTDGFKAVWAQKKLRASMLLSALAFGLIYPFQYMALPLMSTALAAVPGATVGKAAILGQMLGALFFGQLAANVSQTKLGPIKIPGIAKPVSSKLLLQGLVMTMAAAWSLLRLFPGNWLAAAGAVAASAAMMYGGSKFTDRGWIKYLGIGLAAASILPLLFWGSLPVTFTGMLALGLFAGPVQVALNTYFGKNASAASVGNAFGVSSSLNNSATSLGYGLLTAAVAMFMPAFPHVLGPLALAFLGIGAVFFFVAPRVLPGLSARSFTFQKKPADPAVAKN